MAEMLAAVAAAEERIERCHEIVACPRCSAPIGRRCAAMQGYGGGGYAKLEVRVGLADDPTERFVRLGRELKHPHRERSNLVQPVR